MPGASVVLLAQGRAWPSGARTPPTQRSHPPPVLRRGLRRKRRFSRSWRTSCTNQTGGPASKSRSVSNVLHGPGNTWPPKPMTATRRVAHHRVGCDALRQAACACPATASGATSRPTRRATLRSSLRPEVVGRASRAGRAPVLEPATVVDFDRAAFDLDHQRAAVGDREHEIALTVLPEGGAHLHRVPGDPAIGQAGLERLPQPPLGPTRCWTRFVARVEADDGHGVRF